MQDAPYDVCPVNWQIPTGGASGTFQILTATITGITGNISDYHARDVNNSFSTSFSGVFNGTQNYLDNRGYWWSSTFSDGHSMHSFYVYNVGIVGPQGSNYRSDGFSVRCVAD